MTLAINIAFLYSWKVHIFLDAYEKKGFPPILGGNMSGSESFGFSLCLRETFLFFDRHLYQEGGFNLFLNIKPRNFPPGQLASLTNRRGVPTKAKNRDAFHIVWGISGYGKISET